MSGELWSMRRSLRVVVAVVALMTALHAAAQGARPVAPPNWDAIVADVEADRARKGGTQLPIPPGLAVEVEVAQRLGERLVLAAQAAPSETSETARAALKTAEGADVDRCDGLRYRAIALPAKEGDAGDQEVYLLGESRNDDLVIGRHFRVTVTPDGARVRSTQASAVACLRLASDFKHEKSFQWATHFLSCAPSTFHVYISHTAKRPIYISTSVGNWKVAAGQIAFISQRARPCAASRLPDTEGRWVAIAPRNQPDGDRYLISMSYLDPAAGFTAVNGGLARVDENGEFHWVERQPTHYEVRARMQGNPIAHILSDSNLDRLGLVKVPDWLSLYRDTSDPVTRGVRRGRAFNAIGESRLALNYLLPARQERREAEGLGFELAYAFNALRNFDRAIEVASEAFARDGRDAMLCKELAYAYQHSVRLDQASKTYSRCLTLVSESHAQYRAEIAFNLAGVFKGLGALDTCRHWLDKAAEWMPAASQLRSMLAQAQQVPGLCGN